MELMKRKHGFSISAHWGQPSPLALWSRGQGRHPSVVGNRRIRKLSLPQFQPPSWRRGAAPHDGQRGQLRTSPRPDGAARWARAGRLKESGHLRHLSLLSGCQCDCAKGLHSFGGGSLGIAIASVSVDFQALGECIKPLSFPCKSGAFRSTLPSDWCFLLGGWMHLAWVLPPPSHSIRQQLSEDSLIMWIPSRLLFLSFSSPCVAYLSPPTSYLHTFLSLSLPLLALPPRIRNVSPSGRPSPTRPSVVNPKVVK